MSSAINIDERIFHIHINALCYLPIAITLCRRSLPEMWILLETDEAVLACCERPGYTQRRRGTQRILVRYRMTKKKLGIRIDNLAVRCCNSEITCGRA